MTYQFSKREKILLYILALVILLAGGWMGIIIPSLTQKQKAQEELRALEAQQHQIDTIVSALDGVEERLAAEQERAKENQYFYTALKGSEIDRLVQSVLQEKGVKGEAVILQGPLLGELSAYTPPENPLHPLEEQPTEGEEAPALPTLPLYLCTVQMAGPAKNCMDVADAFTAMDKSIHVVAFTLTMPEETPLPPTGTFAAELTLGFYYLEG